MRARCLVAAALACLGAGACTYDLDSQYLTGTYEGTWTRGGISFAVDSLARVVDGKLCSGGDTGCAEKLDVAKFTGTVAAQDGVARLSAEIHSDAPMLKTSVTLSGTFADTCWRGTWQGRVSDLNGSGPWSACFRR